VIAGRDDGMQTGSWYTVARRADDLEAVDHVGQVAAQRACQRLGAKQIKTGKVAVIYEAPVAASLVRHFIGAISGGALYRKASFLLDSLGERVFPDHVRIHEQPHLPRAIGSAAYDNEGVATMPRDIVGAGVLNGYVLGSYSARKLGMETTGNAGGVRNLTLHSAIGADDDFTAMLHRMGRGLLITDLIGHGVNTVTGDYSRGAAGFWVEDGELAYPVEEITVAGNLKDIFKSIAAVGGDVDKRGGYRTGSILIDEMTVAGA
jgi:PmbA protein